MRTGPHSVLRYESFSGGGISGISVFRKEDLPKKALWELPYCWGTGICFRDTNPGLQFQLHLLECWIRGKLLCFSKASMCANGKRLLIFAKPRVGHSLSSDHNRRWQLILPKASLVQNAIGVKSAGSPQSSCGLSPGAPRALSHCPCWCPHLSLPSQFLLAELVTFQISEENYFLQEASYPLTPSPD